MDIKALRLKVGFTQQELSDNTGIPRDRIAKWESGKASPKSDDTLSLMTFFKTKGVWEEFHQGQVLSEEPTPYLAVRRNKKISDNSPFMVPLVPIKAQAGYSKGFANTDFINKLELFPIVPGIDHRGASWRYFEVQGDSMEDTFKEGQYLLASQVIQEDWQNIDNFYVYIIVTDEKVMVKRLAKVRGKDYWAAISDNESKYPQFPIPVREVKELWKYRRHIDWDASPPKKFEIKV